MNMLKKLGLILTAIVFCLSLAVSASYAQPGKAKMSGNSGKHKGWTHGKHRGWDNGRKVGWRRTHNGRYRRVYRRTSGNITPQEARRLHRQRDRISRLYNRSTRDGVLTTKERRKLDKRTTKYNWKYGKAVNNKNRN